MILTKKTKFYSIILSDFLMLIILLLNAYQGKLFAISNLFAIGVILFNFYSIYCLTGFKFYK